VQATGLQAAGAEQLALLRGERWGDLERTVDRIERRFGRGATLPATLLDVERRRGGGPKAPNPGRKAAPRPASEGSQLHGEGPTIGRSDPPDGTTRR
jgi:hypothetical protein